MQSNCMKWTQAASDSRYRCLSSAAKQARLKQAKEEAEKEIAEFRAQMEAEFQRKVAEVKSLSLIEHVCVRLIFLSLQPKREWEFICLNYCHFWISDINSNYLIKWSGIWIFCILFWVNPDFHTALNRAVETRVLMWSALNKKLKRRFVT